MNKFCERLRYSVGGTYRDYGPGKSLSVDKGSSRFFFVFTSSRLSLNGFPANPSVRCPFYSDNDLVPNAPIRAIAKDVGVRFNVCCYTLLYIVTNNEKSYEWTN